MERLASSHEVLITVEEGAIGGFASHVADHLIRSGCLDSSDLKLRTLFMPDRYLDQASPDLMNEEAGLNRDAIVRCVFEALGRETEALQNLGA